MQTGPRSQGEAMKNKSVQQMEAELASFREAVKRQDQQFSQVIEGLKGLGDTQLYVAPAILDELAELCTINSSTNTENTNYSTRC